MKKLFLLLLICVCVGFEGRAQYVTIPDYEFLNFLKTKYPACFNNLNQLDTTCSAIVNEDSLILDNSPYNRPVYSVTGLRYFKNLRYLSRAASNFPLTELPGSLRELFIAGYINQLPPFPSTLSRFTFYSFGVESPTPLLLGDGLRYLEVSGTALRRLVALPDSLQVLVVAASFDTTLGFSLPPGLQILKISSEYIKALPSIPVGLKRLEVTNCDRLLRLPVLPDQLHTLSVRNCRNLFEMPNMPIGLKNLYFPQSYLSSFPGFSISMEMDSINLQNFYGHASLSTLPGRLKFLDISQSNSLRNLPHLPDNLEYLNTTFCTWLTTLPNIPSSLKTMLCSWGNMDSLPTFPASMSMEIVDISNNNIRNLNNLPDSLRHLNCSNNMIKSLPRLPAALKYLYANMRFYQYTWDTSLVMPAMPEGLEVLECSGMGFTSMSAFPSTLKRIICNINRIRLLPSLPPALEYLDCSANPLGTLPALPGTLTDLNCGANRLTTLPLLPASLLNLKCAENYLQVLPPLPQQLKTLDFSYNNFHTFPAVPNKVTTLDCSNNPLYSIHALPDSLKSFTCKNDSLSLLPSLPSKIQILDCSNNQLTELPALHLASLTNLDCTRNRIYCMPTLPRDMGPRYADGYVSTGRLKFDSTIRCLPNLPLNCYFEFPYWNGYYVSTSYGTPALCNPTNNRNHCASFPVMQGIVFYDNNGDGIFNAGEQVKKNVRVSLSNGSFTFTNNNGFYEIGADSLIAYTLSVPAPARFNAVPASYRYTFTSFDTLVVNNFALQPNAVVDSVAFSATALGWAARPGFAFPVMVNYDNVGTTTLTPTITFNYDNTKLTYDSSSNAGVSNNGISLSLNVGSFVPGQQGRFIAYFRVKPTAALGDSIKSTAVLTANALVLNSNMSNVVRGSFDPNDKNATPQLSPSQVAAGQYIDYTIRFQNTGNDTAFNIIITDTLSSDLQVATFRMKGASHTCKTTVKGNVVYFEFLNILLADKNSNEPLSHGFVTFSIQPKATVAANTTINNKAAIYFDYNAPIITNTAGTLIKDFAVLPLHLVSFTALPQFNNSTALSWVTSNEVNSKHFVIEQSSDARNFVAIATVLAKGNSSNQYNSTAIDLNNSLVYYRLKMVDRDGVFTYSPVIKIDRRKNTAGFNVLSNPVKDALIIFTNDPQLNGTSCSIINTQGAVVKQFILQPGNQSVDVKALPHGMYYLKTNNGSSRILLQ